MFSEPVSTNLVDDRPVRALIGIKSKRAFSDYMHKHGLPHYKLNGRVIRFRMTEVEQWLSERHRGEVA